MLCGGVRSLLYISDSNNVRRPLEYYSTCVWEIALWSCLHQSTRVAFVFLSFF